MKAFLTPLVGLATGSAGDFSTRTLKIAGTIFPYGGFINGLIAFILTASALYYFVVLPANQLMSRFHGDTDAPIPKRACPECLNFIPVDARRCAFCTAVVEEEQTESRVT